MERKLRSDKTKKLITFNASDAWKDWLDGFSDYMGTPRSILIDRALREMALKVGYTERTPKR